MEAATQTVSAPPDISIQVFRPHVALFTDERAGGVLASLLKECGCALISTEGAMQPCDVVVIRVRQDLSIVSSALSSPRATAEPDYVFVTDSAADAAHAALTGLGARFVLPLEAALPWLRSALRPLAQVSRARVALSRSMAAIPPVPRLQTSRTLSWLEAAPAGLFEAEQRFRETYVRAVLGKSSSRAAAAAAARVPLRTLSQIVNKLGIFATAR
jgi:hypothetical protein